MLLSATEGGPASVRSMSEGRIACDGAVMDIAGRPSRAKQPSTGTTRRHYCFAPVAKIGLNMLSSSGLGSSRLVTAPRSGRIAQRGQIRGFGAPPSQFRPRKASRRVAQRAAGARPAQRAKLPDAIAKAERHAGHSREASTAFSEACTAFLRIMSRIGANAFEHFRRAALRSAPSSSRCQRDMCLRIRSQCISARRALRCRRNGLSLCFALMSQYESLPSDRLQKFGSEFSITGVERSRHSTLPI